MTDSEAFIQRSRPFLEYLKQLEASWRPLPMEELIEQAGGPERVLFLVVDLLKGFCSLGPLASPRVAALLPSAVRILTWAHSLGVPNFLFACDSHPPDSPEFHAFPPHCLTGSPEAELAEELSSLPFREHFKVLPKRSLDASLGTDLSGWLHEHPAVTRIVVLGDCTDLCIHQTAMHLRLAANVDHSPWEIVVPAGAVNTFDISRETANQVGAMPHDGDLLHLVFLYHMQLNGIKVVSDLT